MKYFIFVLSFLLLVFAFINCDDSNPTKPSQNKPTLPPQANLTISVPNSAAAQVDVQANSVNSLIAYGYTTVQFFMLTTPTQDGDTWTWTAVVDGLTSTVQAKYLTADSISWKYFLDGTQATSGVMYDNWQALDGVSTANGSSGNWLVYQENTSTPQVNITWQLDSNSNKQIIATITTDTLTQTITATENADKSGSLITTVAGQVVFSAEWDSTGAGSYTEYGPNGDVVDSGEWNALGG